MGHNELVSWHPTKHIEYGQDADGPTTYCGRRIPGWAADYYEHSVWSPEVGDHVAKRESAPGYPGDKELCRACLREYAIRGAPEPVRAT